MYDLASVFHTLSHLDYTIVRWFTWHIFENAQKLLSVKNVAARGLVPGTVRPLCRKICTSYSTVSRAKSKSWFLLWSYWIAWGQSTWKTASFHTVHLIASDLCLSPAVCASTPFTDGKCGDCKQGLFSGGPLLLIYGQFWCRLCSIDLCPNGFLKLQAASSRILKSWYRNILNKWIPPLPLISHCGGEKGGLWFVASTQPHPLCGQDKIMETYFVLLPCFQSWLTALFRRQTDNKKSLMLECPWAGS